jgi:hypothetical protein
MSFSLRFLRASKNLSENPVLIIADAHYASGWNNE